MQIFYLILLFTSLSFSQIKQLELRIDSIISIDSILTERKFTIKYHIQNLTNKEVSFINAMYPLDNSYPNVKDLKVFNAIVENENYVHKNIITKNVKLMRYFSNYENAISESEKSKIAQDYKQEIFRDTSKRKTERARILKINDFEYVKSSIYTFQPNEIKHFTETYYWDKKRYYKREDLEYYIDENLPYYLELSMNFFKNEFQHFFSDEEFKKIKSNPNFIDGSLVSNRMEINFKE